MKYPIDRLGGISRRIQELLGEYHQDSSRSLSFDLSWEERTQASVQAMNAFMSKAGTEIFPDLHRLLGEIEALLEGDDPAIKDAIRPILDEAKPFAQHPTNPLGYAELSSFLARLAGHLSVRVIARPYSLRQLPFL